MREWYRRKSLEERREWIARRDPEKVRAADRARHQRHREERLARMRAYQHETRDARRETQREWERRNPEKVAAAKRAWQQRNPEKRAAHNIVNAAVRAGRLVKQPCEECGAGERIHAHHDDYSKPLEVRWLCALHHSEAHRRAA